MTSSTPETIKRIYQCQYDGSIESFNLLIDRCGLNRDYFYILHMDHSQYKSTNKFTGYFTIVQSHGKEPHYMNGLHISPGDLYTYELEN